MGDRHAGAAFGPLTTGRRPPHKGRCGDVKQVTADADATDDGYLSFAC
jgi:hypothetical protein